MHGFGETLQICKDAIMKLRDASKQPRYRMRKSTLSSNTGKTFVALRETKENMKRAEIKNPND